MIRHAESNWYPTHYVRDFLNGSVIAEPLPQIPFFNQPKPLLPAISFKHTAASRKSATSCNPSSHTPVTLNLVQGLSPSTTCCKFPEHCNPS